MVTIEQQSNLSGDRSSGFDYLRLGLAVSVLFWHSFSTSYGFDVAAKAWQSPWVYVLQVLLPMFFALSGYLVAGSLIRANYDLKVFLGFRVLRIFPALCFEVVLSALLLGPLLTTLPLSEYFTNREFFSYQINLVGWPHYLLPGLFKNNPTPGIVNGSIWTIPYELECYIALSLIALLGMASARRSLIALVVCTAASWIYNFTRGVNGVGFFHVEGRVLVLCFLAGVVVYFYRYLIPYSRILGIAALAIAAILMQFDHLIYLAPIFVAYTVVIIGLTNPPRSWLIDRRDYSYGIYLYGAPIQQAIVTILGPYNSYWPNLAIAVVLAFVMAAISYHVVEKPALRLKKFLGKKEPALVEAT